jgi:hypothetical protein
MTRKLLLACAASLALAATGAHANTILDNAGDWATGYAGPFNPDLDVRSFSASFNPGTNAFDLTATLNGPIDTTVGGTYVIGVDTGAGASHPFTAQGAPNVVFDQVIVLQRNGTGAVSGHALTVQIAGGWFGLEVPLSFLPSTGFTNPYDYQFNLWPRSAANQISDFAPNNSDLVAVPEPGVWALMVVGVGMIGATLRRRRTTQLALA